MRQYTSHGWEIPDPNSPSTDPNRYQLREKMCSGPQAGGCQECDDEIWMTTSAMTLHQATAHQRRAIKIVCDELNREAVANGKADQVWTYILESFSYTLGNWQAVVRVIYADETSYYFEVNYDRDRNIFQVNVFKEIRTFIIQNP